MPSHGTPVVKVVKPSSFSHLIINLDNIVVSQYSFNTDIKATSNLQTVSKHKYNTRIPKQAKTATVPNQAIGKVITLEPELADPSAITP